MMNQTLAKFPTFLLTLIVGIVSSSYAYGAATIVIENADPAGVGFNDSTPAAPVGGNNGTTLGQQRLIAFQRAANLWGATLVSGPAIRVRATWEALTCDATSGVLGSSGTQGIWRDFPGAPYSGTWYSSALANSLAGYDLDPNNAEIRARFNINLGTPGCLETRQWYLGLDTNQGSNINLVTVLLHEFSHGLGFQTFTDRSTGAQIQGVPSIYDRFLFDNTAGKTWVQMTDGERVASAINTGNLVWIGSGTASAAPSLLTAGKDSLGRPLLYAPNPLRSGSSVSHWDSAASPNLVMEPSINSNLVHSVTLPQDLTASLFSDIGWQTSVPAPTPTPTPTPPPPPPPAWQPTVLNSNQVQIVTWPYQGRTYAYLKLLFPDAGYRAANWGQMVGSGSNFFADALVEDYTGESVQAVKTTAQIYDLGPLAPGNYNFTFSTSGSVVKVLPFTVSGTVVPNPVDNAREFVRWQYKDFLSREPDSLGWDFWTGEITRCTTNPASRMPGESEAQCIVRKRANTSAAFFLSPEFQNTGYFVLRVYRGSLGRMPFFGGTGDPSRDEFTRDAATVSAGIVVNNSLDPGVINANKQAFVNAFVTRAEFLAIYGGLTNDQYVDRLFQTTGVAPTAAERLQLINGLTNGTENRATVLFKIVDGTQTIANGALVFQTRYGQLFYDQLFNPGFVQMEYFGYMKRDPDDAGYAFWLGKLNQFGNWQSAQMVLAFIASPEYRARFGQP